MDKLVPLAARLEAFARPARTAASPDRRESGTPSARREPSGADPADVTSPEGLERARRALDATLARFGREAPLRARAAAPVPPPPGSLLDIRV